MSIEMVPITLILVEDDADLRAALTEYLQLHGCCVTAVGSGLEFYQTLAREREFQIAIIDLGLPDQPGKVLVEYARHNTGMAVIVITANDTPDTRIDTYLEGADLFIAKPVDSRELLAAVTSLGRRFQERQESQSTAHTLVQPERPAWTLDRGRRLLTLPGHQAIPLNPQEVKLFSLFHAAGSNTVERTLLLTTIYQRDDSSTQRSLDNLIRRLRQKISSSTGATTPILTAYGTGYSFSEPLQLI